MEVLRVNKSTHSQGRLNEKQNYPEFLNCKNKGKTDQKSAVVLIQNTPDRLMCSSWSTAGGTIVDPLGCGVLLEEVGQERA